MSFESIGDEKVLKVIKDSIIKAVDEPTFVRVKGIDFQDGIIEVSVLSRFIKNSSPFRRWVYRNGRLF